MTSIGYAGIAVGYGLLLTMMAIVLAGGGHGVVCLLWVSLSGLILWPIAGAAIAWVDRLAGRAIFVIAMFLHYVLSTVIVAGSGEGGYLSRVWTLAWWLVVTYVAIYLVGQTTLWWAFVSRGAIRRESRSRRSR